MPVGRRSLDGIGVARNVPPSHFRPCHPPLQGCASRGGDAGGGGHEEAARRGAERAVCQPDRRRAALRHHARAARELTRCACCEVVVLAYSET